MTTANVAQSTRETLLAGTGQARVAQSLRETLLAGTGQLRVAQICREVLRAGAHSFSGKQGIAFNISFWG